ncbi:MAG TPA: type III-A CRISPR-associated protein Cas10/Csm1 [Candidatus Brocadiia bacterium]|nr:type III-A CRISPR-associated protein Cas10/Csm1 [Candidatus Brocadiales bacterium]
MDDTIYKIAVAGFFHDIGKFAERGNMNVSQEFLDRHAALYQPCYKGEYTHRHAVYTAAFIDYIEKLLPKEFNKSGWGLDDPFINLAAGHHKPETPLQWVIAMADRVSSGFDRDEFDNYNNGIAVKDYKKTRLLTIFEGIAIDGKWKGDSLEDYSFRYPLKELSPANIFPVDKDEYRLLDSEQASKGYNELFFEFVASLEKLEHKQNVPLWFEHFDSLFAIYASHIPAATVGKVIPDVSLYDHSKSTAALAPAIYLYHMQNNCMEIEKIKDYADKKFLIVTGDFYGIQNFIFTEGGATNKAAAKLLRGRSFAVSLISELAADMLCRKIGLTTASIILNAAGKFTILAPNTNETRNKIKTVEEEINDWLIKMFYGESAIGISFIEASCEDFTSEKFGNLWENLAKESEKKKYNKIKLEKYGSEVGDYLEQFNNDLTEKLCPFCGKRPASPEVENDSLLGEEKSSACKICRDHIYIGTNLVKASRVAVTKLEAEIYGDKLKEPIFGDYQVSFDVTGKLIELADKGVLLKYWDISIPKDGSIAKDITAKFINGYVPVYDDSDLSDERYLAGRKSEQKKLELIDQIKVDKENKVPKTFSHIALKALDKDTNRGIEALGILKADVDNLGLIFACGLRRQTLSRLATLSRQMNYYYSIYLPYALSTEEKFKDIYTVFAGGDDLFMIGPWNRIVDFALFLNDSFREYVCNNSQITISAGISVNKPGEPIPSIAERSEDALKKSKTNKKDSVTLFDEPTKWKEFVDLNKIKETVEGWLRSGTINNAMLFRLNTFAILARQEKELRDIKEGVSMEELECLKWHAMFKYNLVRNIGKHLKGDEKDKTIKEVEKAAEWIKDYGGALKIPIWQVIYNQRKGG